MSDPFGQEQGALSNLPGEDFVVPEPLTEPTAAHLKAIDQQDRDIAKGELDRVLEAVYQPHENDIDLTGVHGLEFPEQEFVVDPLIPKGKITLLAGHGGSFKSLLMLFLALCVSIGREFSGLNVRKGRVLYYSIEDDRNFVGSRLQKMVAKLKVSAAALASGLVVRDMTASNPPFIASFESGGCIYTDEGERLLEDIGSGEFDMVVIDNASEAFAGNENSRVEVAAFYAPLRAAAGKGDCSVVIIAHVNRPSARGEGGNENYSGSTQWHNSARSRLSLKRDGETNRLTLKQEKLNAKPPLKEAISGEFVDGVFEVERRTEKVERDESKQNARDTFRDLLEHVHMIEEEGKKLSDNDHPTTQYKQLSAYSSWPSKKYGKAAGKELVRQGISLMKQEGLLGSEKGYKNGNEHHTVRLTEQGKVAALNVIGGEALVADDEAPF